VDLHWAEEHHDLWLADALAKERIAEPRGQPTPAPAK
jgi:hypothetical protein